jgi:hypothetical protein
MCECGPREKERMSLLEIGRVHIKAYFNIYTGGGGAFGPRVLLLAPHSCKIWPVALGAPFHLGARGEMPPPPPSLSVALHSEIRFSTIDSAINLPDSIFSD